MSAFDPKRTLSQKVLTLSPHAKVAEVDGVWGSDDLAGNVAQCQEKFGSPPILDLRISVYYSFLI